jgi:calcium-dependent protein kinase
LDLNDPAVNTRPIINNFTVSNPRCAEPYTFASTFHPLTIKSMLQGHIKSFQALNVTDEVDKTFTKLDTNTDGYLSKDELKAGLDSLQQTYTDQEL